MSVQIEESENAQIIDDRQSGRGAVETHHVRTRLEGIPEDQIESVNI